jgi:hypothetical protein
MTLFDLFSKRRKFLQLYERVWALVESHLSIKADPADEIAHRLACFYYACVVYSLVYQTGVAVGMSSSSAFSVTRIQLSKYPFDEALRERVDTVFSADATARERDFADQLQVGMQRIVIGIKSGQNADSLEVAGELATIEQLFLAQDFASHGIYPPLSVEA